MAIIRFYHLQKQTLDQALPLILQKAIQQGNIVVKTADAAQIKPLSKALWIFRADSFLPHGSATEGHAEDQPIWLTDKDENPNDAKILILTHGAQTQMHSDFDLCCEMFDGRDQEAVSAARQRWKDYQAAGHTLAYWQQDEQGRWSEKATSASSE